MHLLELSSAEMDGRWKKSLVMRESDGSDFNDCF